MRIPKFVICNRWFRQLLLKLPRWNWVLEVLYPDDLELEIEFKDKDNG